MFTTSDKKTFIESSHDSFNVRQKSVFGELDKLEKDRPGSRYSEEELSESRHKTKVKLQKRTTELVGQESIFKRPNTAKRNWLGKIPDHKLNPHRWTKYDLCDVSEMSESSNTAAAMSFLREQGSPISQPKDDEIRIAPKFTKVAARIELVPPRPKPPSEHPLFKSTKREMPEYVVGQKKPRRPCSKTPKEQVTSQIKLDHLLEDE